MLAGRLGPTPIVHCEADYRLPVRAGDKLTAQLTHPAGLRGACQESYNKLAAQLLNSSAADR